MKNFFGAVPGRGLRLAEEHPARPRHRGVDSRPERDDPAAPGDSRRGDRDGRRRADHGRPRHVGFVGMSRDLVSLDATAARVIGLDPARLPYLARGGRFLGNLDERRIEQRGEPVARFASTSTSWSLQGGAARSQRLSWESRVSRGGEFSVPMSQKFCATRSVAVRYSGGFSGERRPSGTGTSACLEQDETGAEMYRVSDVLKPDFARSWHEAVAIVQEVASQLVPGAAVPEPDDLLLDAAARCSSGSARTRRRTRSRRWPRCCRSLLEGIDAPGGLRDLADDNARPTPPILGRGVPAGPGVLRAARPGQRSPGAGGAAATPSRVEREPGSGVRAAARGLVATREGG